jgi:uncharacterized membrane protein
MILRRYWLLALALVIMLGFSAVMYDSLPEEIPSQWGLEGEVNDTMSRTMGVLFVPGLTLLIWLVLEAAPHIDPRRESYDKFLPTYRRFAVYFLLFMTGLHIGSLLVADQASSTLMPRFILGGVGLLFVGLGNEMGRIRPTWFVGIRTPWTLSNEEVWRQTHRLGGRLMTLAGFIILASAVILPLPWTAPVLIVAVVLAAGVPIVYSYILWRRISQQVDENEANGPADPV